MKNEIIIASGNTGKIKEAQNILNNFQITSIKEIEESTKKIENITNKKVNIYRAPYGEYNDTVIKAANDKNLKTIQWNLDTLDYTGLSGEEMWDRLKDKTKGVHKLLWNKKSATIRADLR